MADRVRNALQVRCTACGAACRAVDADTVECAYCGVVVAVPDDVRLFVQAIHILDASSKNATELAAHFHVAAEDAPFPVTKVDANCACCGFPLQYGAADKERCPACGTESVAHVGGTAKVFLAGLREIQARRAAMLEQAVRTFPVAKRAAPDTWHCGGCGTPLRTVGKSFEPCDGCGKRNETHQAMSLAAMYRAIANGTNVRDAMLADIARRIAEIEAQEAAILAQRPPLSRVLGPFALAFATIVAFCYVGYRIDVATTPETPRPKPPELIVLPPDLSSAFATDAGPFEDATDAGR